MEPVGDLVLPCNTFRMLVVLDLFMCKCLSRLAITKQNSTWVLFTFIIAIGHNNNGVRR